ncbi:hypothetical protein MRB53_028503 [Persea americana]|uniref:Uncharacterized protein n=1 Tax=Persea americana TaxID=3435 RepID=A0ACC2KFR2_PERAE|nr:hypothetical protein MRB53_028503 [Persea americana]
MGDDADAVGARRGGGAYLVPEFCSEGETRSTQGRQWWSEALSVELLADEEDGEDNVIFSITPPQDQRQGFNVELGFKFVETDN